MREIAFDENDPLAGHAFHVVNWDDTEDAVLVLAVDRSYDLIVVEYLDDGAVQRMSLKHLLIDCQARTLPSA